MTDAQTKLQPGDTAPAFTLPDADGTPVSLADHLGRKVIVYFYPAALTPGCTKQACDFTDNLDVLAGAGYDVIGISPDKPEKLGKFREKEQLKVTLLADTEKEVLTAYGITGGFPASKIVLGVPFYFRGWTGVPAGSNYGLYQSATGASPAQTFTQQAGIADWKELAAKGLTTGSNVHWDATTQSSWIYDGTNFYTGDTPQAITARGAYATSKGLGGIFAFSFEGDDSSGSLINAMNSSMQ